MTTMRLLTVVLVIGLLVACAAGSYAQGRGHGGGHGGPGYHGGGHGPQGGYHGQSYGGHHNNYGGPRHINYGWQPVPQTVIYGNYYSPCPPQPIYGVNMWGQVVIVGYR